MVWIYLNAGFEEESPRKKFGICFLGSDKIIKMRLIDIRVDFSGNPFLQKCWEVHFLAKGLPKNLNI